MAWISPVISVVGGLIASNSAGSGVSAQAAGASEATRLQKEMYDTTRADQTPFLRTGTAANNRLAAMMGIGPKTSAGTAGFTPTTEQQYYASPTGKPTVDKQRGYQTYLMLRQPMGDDPGIPQTYEEWSREHPLTGGVNGDSYESYLASNPAVAATEGFDNSAGYGDLMRKFSLADMEADPVYQSGLQFGLDEGRKGIERQGAATGSALSGATLKALSRFGSDYGSTKAGESYNRYTQRNTDIYNKLAGLSGTGQVSSQQVGAAGKNYADQVGQTAQNLGNARAASGIASTNALTGGITNALGNYQSQQYLDLLKKNYGSTGSSASYPTGMWNYD